jgi:hypothetical protein
MRALPHLAESVYVEGTHGTAVPVFGAGTPLPAVRRHTLPGPQSHEVSLDLHLLHGSTSAASDSQSLGHWRISGAQPSHRPTSHLRIQFVVDAAGGLELMALQDKRQLTITPLEQGTQRIAVDPTGIEPASLANAWAQLEAGEGLQVQEQLVAFLQSQPDSLAAWALLAALVDEPLRKADCYRQILRFDPGNLAALAALQAIPPQEARPARPAPRPQTLPMPSLRQDGALICPRCGAVMEVRDSEPRGKHAFCPGCGAAIELPVTFGTGEAEPTGAAGAPSAAGHEGQREPETDARLRDEDALIAELVKSPPVPRAPSTATPEGGLFSRLARRLGREPAPSPRPRPTTPDSPAIPGQDPLDPKLVLQLAGGPLTAEERVQCPECGATVSRDRETCPWCSASLT